MTQIYFSNDLNQLAEYLGNRLFANGKHPFARRTIIVPSDRYKRFLQQFFAENSRFQIAAGMQITTLPTWLSEHCFAEMKKNFPSHLLLEFRLYCMAKELALEPLKKLSDQQLRTVCKELAHLFHKYGAHGEKFLKEWLAKEGWPQSLWRGVYANMSWSYPVELFEKSGRLKEVVHLFGFASMPTAQAIFFKKQESVFYLFSPCQLFWADILSAKERAYLRISGEDATLLSSWGKWGKRLLNALSTEEMQTEEDYVEPDDAHVLGALQKSLFDLEPPMFPPSEDSASLRIFSAMHCMQEVEELFEEIHRILQEREDISLSDILVLAPDISAYVPYLHGVFGKKESDLGYVIRGLERREGSSLAAGVESLFDLIDKQWSLTALLQLFSQPSFYKKRRWKSGDLEQIERWLSSANATWGFDGRQREEYLHVRGSLNEPGTFRFAIDRLIFGLSSTDTKEAPTPLALLEWADVDLFSTLIEVIEDLSCDLRQAVSGEQKTICEWIGWLVALLDKYFVQDEDAWLKEDLVRFQMACQGWQEKLFTWRDGKKVYEELSSAEKKSYQSHNLQAVQFDSLKEGTILDKKVIVLMGMQDSAFPRQEADTSLDELNPKAPSRGEIDRFLFLEAFIKAKDILLISFLHTCPEKQIELPASLVVQELCSYCEQQGKKIDIRTLTERNYTLDALQEAPYFSASRYRRANAYADRSPKDSRLFRDWYEYNPLPENTLPEDNEIDLDDLRMLLKDPLEFFFRKTLDIRIDWTDDSSFEEEEFLLKTYEKKKILHESLKSSLEEALRGWEREKGLPISIFKEMAIHKLNEERNTILEGIQRHQIVFEDCTDIKISPWSIELGEGKQITLTGKIKGVSSQGIMEFFGEDKKKVTLERWSDLLILKGHPDLQKFPSQVFFVQAKENATRVLSDVDPIEELKKLLSYYALCKKRPSPFLFGWSKALLKGEKENLEKGFSGRSLARYAKWIIDRDGVPDAGVLCDTWSAYLQSTFSGYATI